MSYTYNMEPRPDSMRAMFNHDMLTALTDANGVMLAKELQNLKAESSPVAGWAEAVGTRLQIRDFLLKQKGQIAGLRTDEHTDLRQDVTGILKQIDEDLSVVTGHQEQGSV